MSSSLQAGFARADISPRGASVPLAGYGATSLRMSSRILDPLFVHATALESGMDRCVLMVLDNLCAGEETVALWRKAIGETTGLAADRIFISTTHTHAAPDLRSTLPSAVEYRDVFLTQSLAETAARALADLKPAQLSYGVVDVGRPGFRLNFDRHYMAVPIEKKDSYTKEDLVPDVGAVRSASLKGEGYVASYELCRPRHGHGRLKESHGQLGLSRRADPPLGDDLPGYEMHVPAGLRREPRGADETGAGGRSRRDHPGENEKGARRHAL